MGKALSDDPRNIRRRTLRAADPAKYRAAEKAAYGPKKLAAKNAWDKKNPHKRRATNRLIKFGITQEEWDAQFAVQNYACAICSREDPGWKRDWCTDHDHNTGHLRGILCAHCNSGLGRFHDSSVLLRLAAEYIDVFTQL